MSRLKLILSFLISYTCTVNKTRNNLSSTINSFEKKLKSSVQIFAEVRPDELGSSRSAEEGNIKRVSSKNWTSGFSHEGIMDDVQTNQRQLLERTSLGIYTFTRTRKKSQTSQNINLYLDI